MASPKCDFCYFLKKCTFFKQQNGTIALSPALEHHFCEVSPVPKYAKINLRFFENCIFPCNYAHFHGQRRPKWWKLHTRDQPPEPQKWLRVGLDPKWTQNGSKMGPQWSPKWTQFWFTPVLVHTISGSHQFWFQPVLVHTSSGSHQSHDFRNSSGAMSLGIAVEPWV